VVLQVRRVARAPPSAAAAAPGALTYGGLSPAPLTSPTSTVTGGSGGGVYAMKVLRKRDLIARRQVRRTLAERRILSHVRHPFVVSLAYAFQSRARLFLVMEFVSGGDLFTHLSRYGAVSEERAALYTAEVALALEHLHAQGIVYRCVWARRTVGLLGCVGY
jgi:serine/threonine protein kinase